MNELALFAGAGGGILGGLLLGFRTVCAVEIEPYCRKVLLQRQRDGILPRAPIWDDVRTFDGKPWRGKVDIITGGFPCQDISVAGKGAGIEGERSGLWAEMFRIICEVRPSIAFVENSPALTARGLGRVLGDLASIGYNAEWGVLGADSVGANHRRKRIWILAYSNLIGQQTKSNGICYSQAKRVEKTNKPRSGGEISYSNKINDYVSGYGASKISQLKTSSVFNNSNAMRSGCAEQYATTEPERQGYDSGVSTISRAESWWATEPDVGRVAHGVASRVDRLKTIGNGQIPLCMAYAFCKLAERINK